jgi:hypothetical protein
MEEVQDFITWWLYAYDHQWANMAVGAVTTKQKLPLVAQLLLSTSINRTFPMHEGFFLLVFFLFGNYFAMSDCVSRYGY